LETRADKPGLVYFHSSRSGKCRRIEGYIAQVLQHRRNHETFKYYAVAQEQRPDLLEKFGIATAAEVDAETLAARYRAEVVRTNFPFMLLPLVTAWAHKPIGSHAGSPTRAAG